MAIYVLYIFIREKPEGSTRFSNHVDLNSSNCISWPLTNIFLMFGSHSSFQYENLCSVCSSIFHCLKSLIVPLGQYEFFYYWITLRYSAMVEEIFFSEFRIEPRAMNLLGKCSTTGPWSCSKWCDRPCWFPKGGLTLWEWCIGGWGELEDWREKKLGLVCKIRLYSE